MNSSRAIVCGGSGERGRSREGFMSRSTARPLLRGDTQPGAARKRKKVVGDREALRRDVRAGVFRGRAATCHPRLNVNHPPPPPSSRQVPVIEPTARAAAGSVYRAAGKPAEQPRSARSTSLLTGSMTVRSNPSYDRKDRKGARP